MRILFVLCLVLTVAACGQRATPVAPEGATPPSYSY